MTDEDPGDEPVAGRTGQVLSGGHHRLGAPLTPAVWSARDVWDGRDVVAVALTPDGDDGALTRVARDVRRAGEHRHPGLAPVRDVAAGTDRTLWLVHDVPAGARGIADAGPVPARVLLRRALVLAGALATAHAARLVHGHISADVVLVGPGEPGPDEDAVWLLGAASGVRPDDRPAAEDDDTRALAACLAALPVEADDLADDLADRLAAVLAGSLRPAGSGTSGGLGVHLRRELRSLTEADPTPDAAPAPDEEPARRTEVVPVGVPAATRAPTRPVHPAPHPAAAGPVPAGPVAGRPTTRVGLPPVGAAPVGAAPAGAARPAPARPRPPVVAPPRPPRPGTPGMPPGPPGRGPRRTPGPPRGPAPTSGGPARRPRGLVLLAAAAALLLLLGAVVAVAVTLAGDDTQPAPQDRVVPAAIGDPRTVDPCSLVDPVARGLAAAAGPRLPPP